MKRTGIKRGKPLKRGKGLKPGKPLKRTGIKRKPPKPTNPGVPKAIKRAAQEAFSRGIRKKRCVRCNRAAPGVVIRAHHVLRRGVIERELRSRGATERQIVSAAWDTRNRLPVCDQCHERHHKKSHKLRISEVIKHAPKAIQLARELDLLDKLMADYDKEDSHG